MRCITRYWIKAEEEVPEGGGREGLSEPTKTHLLMRQDVAPYRALFPLNKLHIRLHPLLGESAGEFVVDVGVRVKAGELASGVLDGTSGTPRVGSVVVQ